MAKIKPEFDKRGVKIIGLSVDPIDRQEPAAGHFASLSSSHRRGVLWKSNGLDRLMMER
jgi:hypothetical protein